MLKLGIKITFIKNFFRLFLLILFVLSVKPAQADHVMGADMGYKCLGNGKYKIIITDMWNKPKG